MRRGSSDLLVFQEVFLMRQYYRAFDTLGLSPLPGEGFRVLDLGANVGLAAVMFARLVPAAGIMRCVRCEIAAPDPTPCGAPGFSRASVRSRAF